MKGYLIISNCPEDQKFTDKLKADLCNGGISVWGGGAGGDAKYVVGAAEAIKRASSFVLICSGYSVKSPMMKVEFAAANRAEVPVIMVSIDSVGLDVVKRTNAKADKIDFFQNYDNGLTALMEILEGRGEDKCISKHGGEKPERYLFLSYAEVDTPFMKEVKAFLDGKGYAYWEFQGSDRDYQAGLGFEIEKVLREATATLTILSPGWKQSKWSMKEFMFSQQIGIPVFLLRFQDTGPTLLIADILYIDFVGDKARGFELLEKELKAVFQKHQSKVP